MEEIVRLQKLADFHRDATNVLPDLP